MCKKIPRFSNCHREEFTFFQWKIPAPNLFDCQWKIPHFDIDISHQCHRWPMVWHSYITFMWDPSPSPGSSILIIRYPNTYSTHCNILHVANLHNFTKKQELQFNNMLFITYVVCGNVLRTWTFISYVREHTLRTYVCVLCPLWEKKGGKGGKNKIINKNIKCTSRVCCILCGLMRKEAKSTACIGSKVRKRSVEVKMSYFTTTTKNATCFTNKDPGPPYLVSRIT